MSSSARRFVLPQPTEFKLQEKTLSLSGDSFSIKRADTGDPYFKVKGKALSLKDSNTLLDMNGTPIYKMNDALMSLRGRMYIIDPTTKQPVITLRKRVSFRVLGVAQFKLGQALLMMVNLILK